ncbi:uncharacterized protein [Centruroides vittatus]|uniref:uncharacterized protein n=1 Tax=Centruroides vittatus TaxID=120091 RepID=UPI003510612A
MVYMKTCCYCFKNTKDGSLACAIFFMVMCVINANSYIYVLNNKEALHSASKMLNIEEYSARKMYVYYLIETVIVFLCSLLLGYGVKTDNRHLFLPWICCVCLECFGFVVIFTFIIYSSAAWGFHPALAIIVLFLLFGFLFLVYMLLCVLSQYQLLANGPLPVTYRMANTTNTYEIDNGTYPYGMANVTPNYGMPSGFNPYGMPTMYNAVVTMNQPGPYDKSVPVNAYMMANPATANTYTYGSGNAYGVRPSAAVDTV